jgi:KaiC/GvpD/RAD55 family RecA-like ATPase
MATDYNDFAVNGGHPYDVPTDDFDPGPESEQHAAPGAQNTNGSTKWPPLGDLVRRLGNLGEPIPLEVGPLDGAMRGGLRRGRVLVLAGAPGAGKTTIAVAAGVDRALNGDHVAILACDETASGLVVRIGQLLGLVREDIERGDPATLEHLAADVEARLPTLLVVDADETRATIEAVGAELARRAAGARTLMVVDSAQTARSDGSDGARSPRERVDAVVASIRRVAKTHGHAVVVTSEVSRGYYRGGDGAPLDPLAAAKESGGVEYAADVLVVLRSVPNGDGDVDLDVAKNRLGSKVSVRMRPDFARARYSPIGSPPPATAAGREDARDAREDAAVEAMVQTLVAALLRARSPVTSRHGLADLIGGRRTRRQAAVARALATGAIVSRPDPSRGRRDAVVFVVPSAADEAVAS